MIKSSKLLLAQVTMTLGISFLIGVILIAVGYLLDIVSIMALGIVFPILSIAFMCFYLGVQIKKGVI